MKKLKKVIPIIIAFIIGISTTVGAATVFNSKDITYSSDKTTKTNVKDSLDELYERTTGNVEECPVCQECPKCPACPEGFACYKLLSSVIKVGDYINMTPTSTSYSISTSVTGYTVNQTINPSELKIWRVIRKNSDGSVDAVSEHVSSSNVYFRGQAGYMNYIGGLNTIAAQYTNTKYVSKTRHIGYSNQTLKCTSFASCPQDSGHTTDLNLVKTATGSYIGKNPSGKATSYWVSRRFIDSATSIIYYNGFRIKEDGTQRTANCGLFAGGTSSDTIEAAFAVRPILTFKSTLKIESGSGTSSSPYKLL